jgi:hypothetical protein
MPGIGLYAVEATASAMHAAVATGFAKSTASGCVNIAKVSLFQVGSISEM